MGKHSFYDKDTGEQVFGKGSYGVNVREIRVAKRIDGGQRFDPKYNYAYVWRNSDGEWLAFPQNQLNNPKAIPQKVLAYQVPGLDKREKFQSVSCGYRWESHLPIYQNPFVEED
jgi:hypothetical protein